MGRSTSLRRPWSSFARSCSLPWRWSATIPDAASWPAAERQDDISAERQNEIAAEGQNDIPAGRGGMRTAPFLLACLLATVAAAPADPDWPCVQRLVPTLTAATLWAGPAPKGDWHADKEVA